MAGNLSRAFKYTVQFADAYGLFSRPLVTAKFSRLGSPIEIPVLALIDSGAPATLLHSKIGKILGIDVERGELATFGGIGGVPIAGYKHQVMLQIVGIDREVEIDAWFSDIAGTDALLGSVGFFDNFKVVFEQYKNQFEIASKHL